MIPKKISEIMIMFWLTALERLSTRAKPPPTITIRIRRGLLPRTRGTGRVHSPFLVLLGFAVLLFIAYSLQFYRKGIGPHLALR